jgi:hypothetical protein
MNEKHDNMNIAAGACAGGSLTLSGVDGDERRRKQQQQGHQVDSMTISPMTLNSLLLRGREYASDKNILVATAMSSSLLPLCTIPASTLLGVTPLGAGRQQHLATILQMTLAAIDEDDSEHEEHGDEETTTSWKDDNDLGPHSGSSPRTSHRLPKQ